MSDYAKFAIEIPDNGGEGDLLAAIQDFLLNIWPEHDYYAGYNEKTSTHQIFIMRSEDDVDICPQPRCRQDRVEMVECPVCYERFCPRCGKVK